MTLYFRRGGSADSTHLGFSVQCIDRERSEWTHDLGERAVKPEGRAHEHWERAAQDLDREEMAIRRSKTHHIERGVRIYTDSTDTNGR